LLYPEEVSHEAMTVHLRKYIGYGSAIEGIISESSNLP